LYNTANMPGDRNMQEQIAAIQQQIANSNAINQAGRQAANAASNSQLGLIKNAGQAIGGVGSLLGGLFGGGGGSGGGNSSLSNYYGNQAGTANGITGYGNGITDMWGNPTPALGNAIQPGSIYDNQQFGYGSMPAGDYFGGGGFGGTPTSSDPWSYLE
jgi:hypothetical protein